ncbi:MAG TPA: lipopolysaccharide kinase InaA family protein [Gemmatimonadaceae bacterium]|nr:lipopolysaccharide kinase InaA family protein [Gemmatimonadaceae bacterium]
MTRDAPPPGYERARVGRAELVARHELVPALREILAGGTVYAYAAGRPDHTRMTGRQPAYAIALPGGERVVVRHNRHGGTFAGMTRDLFHLPTRAPLELAISARLAGAGVPTPLMLGYVVYPVAGVLARSDVMTREIAPGRDLAAALGPAEPASARAAAIAATATLVAVLSRAGARHHDLNVKNVLLAGDVAAPTAYLLDVDRVTFHADRGHCLETNLARLERSARKWRDRFGAPVTDDDLARLRADAQRQL